MPVPFDETGNRGLAVQVDYFSGISNVNGNVRGTAYRNDSITDGCNRLCGGSLIINSDHVAVGQHQVCDRLSINRITARK
jgi:hypothetical protein